MAPPPPADASPQILQIEGLTDHPEASAAFLEHWRPNIGLWVAGELLPNLISAAADRLPLFLIDVDEEFLIQPQRRWLPDLTRPLLMEFAAIYARDEDAKRRLLQLGVAPNRVHRGSALLAGGTPPPCSDMDHRDLAAAMKGRPAWCAIGTTSAEIGTVLAAHRKAMQLSHRLILLLLPADAAAAEEAERVSDAQGRALEVWDDGALPDEATQVLMSRTAADAGLFLRSAPLCFIGGTLAPEGPCNDPLEAAALGSAVLYGPKVRHHMPSYSRLVAAGAARIVNDTDALSAAVSHLVSPDHAAAMAHAGWEVISEGAALVDEINQLVQDHLDAAGLGVD